jgi:hypothetical protein
MSGFSRPRTSRRLASSGSRARPWRTLERRRPRGSRFASRSSRGAPSAPFL